MMTRRSSIGLMIWSVLFAGSGCCPFAPVVVPEPTVDIDIGGAPDGIVGQNADGWKIYRTGGKYEIYDPILEKWYPAKRNYQNDTVDMDPKAVEKWREDRAKLPADRRNGGVTVKPQDGGGGAVCFAAETLILMADGSRKPIIDVKMGDWVKAYNEKTGEIEDRRVALTEEGRHDDYYLINGTLKATPPHPFFTVDRGWIGLDRLKVGDRIKDKAGETAVVSIEKIDRPLKIYNIRVEILENFFVSGDGRAFFLVK